jgi:hypothetical protein
MLIWLLVLVVVFITIGYRHRHPDRPSGQGSVLWPALWEFAGHDRPAALVLLSGMIIFYSVDFATGPAWLYVRAYGVFALLAVVAYVLDLPLLHRTGAALLARFVTPPVTPEAFPHEGAPGVESTHSPSALHGEAWHRAETASRSAQGGTRSRSQIAWADAVFRPRSHTVAQRIDQLQQALDIAVIGQERGKAAVVDALTRAWVGVRASKGPIAALIFTGPTGVGKTEMAEAVASALHWPCKFFPLGQAGGGDGTVAWKLFGPEPGYRGSERGGELTQFLRANPESVLVFDEFEKALRHDPTCFQSLLHLLSEGRVKDNSSGHVFDASRCLVIFTSNLLAHEPALDQLDGAQLKALFGQQAGVPQEFLGRITGIVPFRALQPAEVEQIAKKIVNAVLTTFLTQNKLGAIQVDVGPGVLPFLVQRTDARYGVRDLQQVIDEHVGSALATAWVTTAQRPLARLALTQDGKRIAARLT